MKRDLYAEVSARIVTELEAGAAPWVKPWSATPGANTPCNAVSNRPYSGCNVVLLWMAQAAGYRSPPGAVIAGRARWPTFSRNDHRQRHDPALASPMRYFGQGGVGHPREKRLSTSPWLGGITVAARRYVVTQITLLPIFGLEKMGSLFEAIYCDERHSGVGRRHVILCAGCSNRGEIYELRTKIIATRPPDLHDQGRQNRVDRGTIEPGRRRL